MAFVYSSSSRSHVRPNGLLRVPQFERPNPDAETPEEIVPDGQEFLDNPNRADEDGAPELMYEKPDTDEEATQAS